METTRDFGRITTLERCRTCDCEIVIAETPEGLAMDIECSCGHLLALA